MLFGRLHGQLHSHTTQQDYAAPGLLQAQHNHSELEPGFCGTLVQSLPALTSQIAIALRQMQPHLLGGHVSDRMLTPSSRHHIACQPRQLLQASSFVACPRVHPQDRLCRIQANARARKTAAPEEVPVAPDSTVAAEEAPKKTRTRRTKSQTAAAEPVPEASPALDTLAEAAPKKTRTRRTKSQTAAEEQAPQEPAPAPVSQLELQPELPVAANSDSYSQDTHKTASGAAAVYDTPSADTAQLDIELASQRPAVPAVNKGGRPRKVQPTPDTAREPEASDGSYGVQAGLPYDSHEKAALRAVIGHDIYELPRNLSQETSLEGIPLPRKYHLPQNPGPRDLAVQKYLLAKDYWDNRAEHQMMVHDAAWQAHHRSRESGINIYSNTRRVAGLMTTFENDDFMLQNKAPSSIAPWARAEIVFATELDEFNTMLSQQLTQTGKRLPQEAQDEELDLLDEALFLLRPDEDNAASARSQQQSAEQELVDTYLEGILPGATLDNLAAAYADDIFAGDGDEFDDDSFISKAIEDADKPL